MGTSELAELLDAILPDERVAHDFRRLLGDDDAHVSEVEIDSKIMTIPRDVRLELVTKAFFKEYHHLLRDTGYRVQVAIGGINRKQEHFLEAGYCFATAYYDADTRLITVDFHAQPR